MIESKEQRRRRLHRRWLRKNKARRSLHLRRAHLKRTYGMSAAEYATMIKQQDDRCAICRAAFQSAPMKGPCVDHSHRTGFVRGLLCRVCNSMLGMAKDDPDILWAAHRYLRERGP